MSDVTPQIELFPQASPDGVTFTFAAGRPLRSVAVAGTFNSWRGDASPLQRIDAGRWQTTLPVSPGRHLYKYVLEGEEWVPDPANPWVSEDGQGNSCFTLTEAGELYVRRGEFGPTHPGPLFRDHAATPSPEWLRDAVIYELSARAVGGLSGVRERLPYLRELGATALWLMPIQPVGLQHRSGSLGDPYAVRDFLAIDPALGTPEDMRALVDDAHAQGLRVILDWTLNRSSIDNPLTEQRPEWFQRDASGRVTYHVPGRPAFAGFDFAQRGLRRYLIDAMLQWVTRYDLDGLRFDDSDLVPLDFLREIRAALLVVRPELALISQSYDELHHLGACDLSYEGGVRELIRQIARGEAEPLALQRYWEEATYSFPRGALRMRWLEEKEQGRAFQYFGRALHAAAASLLLTLDGAPLLLMGQEFEEPGWQSWETLFEPFALGRPPAGSAIFAHYRALLGLRASHPALRRGEVQFVPAGGDRVVRYWRVLGAERLCVTVNLAGEWRRPAAHPAPVELLYRHDPIGSEHDALPPFGTTIEREV
jgi:glycosidase